MFLEIIAFVLAFNLLSILWLIILYQEKDSDKGPIAYKPWEWTAIDFNSQPRSLKEKIRFSM